MDNKIMYTTSVMKMVSKFCLNYCIRINFNFFSSDAE